MQVSQVVEQSDGSIEFTLLADAIAPFVFINLRDVTHGWFSNNGFTMVTPEATLTYTPKDPINGTYFQDQLDIMSLWDVTAVA